VIGAAVKVMRIATGEETEELGRAKSAAAELGTRGGRAELALKASKTTKLLTGAQGVEALKKAEAEDVVALIDVRSVKITRDTLVG
jgi:hypothetical protein